MAEHIQIGATAPRIQYAANGTQTSFTYPFAIFAAADLQVWLDDAQQQSGYSVLGAGETGGGAVLFAVAPANGVLVTIRRRLVIARQSDYQTDGVIRARTLNNELDFQTAALQQLAEDVAAAPRRAPFSPSNADLTLPEPVAGRALVWNDAASRLVNSAGAVDALNPGAAAGVYFTPLGSTLLRSVASRLHERRSVLDFIPADLHADIRDHSSTADLSASLQAALDAGAGHFPPGCYTIYSPLTSSAGAVINMAPGAFINPQGAGYTALTITGETSQYSHDWNIHIHRADFSTFPGNGIFWDNPANTEIGSLKVYACDGFGVKLSRMWDCHINSISTVYCGNADNYAFSIEDGGDTSNQSVLAHVQVELSNAKAISISSNTRHVTFLNIHTERTMARDGVISHFLGGGWCNYKMVRLQTIQANGVGKVQIYAGNSKYRIFMEDSTPLEIGGINGLPVFFQEGSFAGTVSTVVDQNGILTFENCTFQSLSIGTSNGVSVRECEIGALTLGYIAYESPPGDELTYLRKAAIHRKFERCKIGTLGSISNNAAACFVDCEITSSLGHIFYWHIFDKCNISGTVQCGPASFLEMRGCRVEGAVTSGWHSQGWLIDTEIIGDLTGDGVHQSFAFDNIRVSGSITSHFLSAPNYGTWRAGQRSDRLIAAAAQPMGWTFDGTSWLPLPSLP